MLLTATAKAAEVFGGSMTTKTETKTEPQPEEVKYSPKETQFDDAFWLRFFSAAALIGDLSNSENTGWTSRHYVAVAKDLLNEIKLQEGKK